MEYPDASQKTQYYLAEVAAAGFQVFGGSRLGGTVLASFAEMPQTILMSWTSSGVRGQVRSRSVGVAVLAEDDLELAFEPRLAPRSPPV